MSDKNTARKFRSAFGGGYQKNDVNEYIESMQAEFSSIEQTLKGTINHQREELDALRAAAAEAEEAKATAQQLQEQLAETAAAMAECRTQMQTQAVSLLEAQEAQHTAEAALAASRAQAEAVCAERDDIRAEAEGLREALATAEAEKQALQTRIKEIEDAEQLAAACECAEPDTPQPVENETVVPADYEALKLKAEQYDRMSAHVGAIMLKANANAEEVLGRAKAEAQAMLTGVNAELAETRTRAQNAAEHLIEDVSGQLAEISRGCRDEISVDLEDLRGALNTLVGTVENKYREINQKLDYAKEEMEHTAAAAIRTATAPRILKENPAGREASGN